jgi:transposase
MQLKTILNRVQKFKSFVYGEARWDDPAGGRLKLIIPVTARANSRPVCPGCEKPSAGYDTLAARRFEFIPVWNIAVFFEYALRRVDCRRCGVRAEKLPWSSGKSTLTRTYMQFLAHWARKLSWKETAVSFQTSWGKVCQAVEYVVDWGLKHRQIGPVFAIGVDEIQYSKGHKYLTLVYQIDDLKRLLWIGQERTVESFEKFFDMIGPEVSAGIEFVCSDMWKAYLRVIREKCGQALHILDRFHIVAKMNEALDDVRAQEARKLKAAGQPMVLHKTRWCLLKREENLTESQSLRLGDLLRANLKTVRAYLLKEQFHQFWTYISPAWAGKFLDAWCRQTMRSRIEPMKKIAKMLRSHRELILNYFKARGLISNGIVEGFNNKAKLTMRKSYGFRSFRITELALYHSLGNLPEPELTHRFY